MNLDVVDERDVPTSKPLAVESTEHVAVRELQEFLELQSRSAPDRKPSVVEGINGLWYVQSAS